MSSSNMARIRSSYRETMHLKGGWWAWYLVVSPWSCWWMGRAWRGVDGYCQLKAVYTFCVDNRFLIFMPLWAFLRIAGRERIHLTKQGKVSLQSGWTISKESIKLGIRREGENGQQSNKEAVDQVSKQNMNIGVNSNQQLECCHG